MLDEVVEQMLVGVAGGIDSSSPQKSAGVSTQDAVDCELEFMVCEREPRRVRRRDLEVLPV